MTELPFPQAVRKRPGMYICDTQSATGANYVVFELVANVLDQFLAGTATYCEVTVDGFSITVSDDGPGLPFQKPSNHSGLSKAEVFLTQPHFGATAEGHAPHVHVVFNGVGLAVVNALCSDLSVRTRDGQQEWTHAYQAGIAIGAAKVSTSAQPHGTQISAHLDPEIFDHPPDPECLMSTLAEQTHLFPGFKLVFNGTTFTADRGLLALAESLHTAPHRPTLWQRLDHGALHIDLALVGSAPRPKHWKSWVNGVPTPGGGTHHIALERALAQENCLPAVCLLHVVMKNPEYAGPCKDELMAPALQHTFEAAFREVLKDWSA